MAFRQIANARFLAASLETRAGLFATIEKCLSHCRESYRPITFNALKED